MNVAVRVVMLGVAASFLFAAEAFARGVTLEQACVEVLQQGKTGDALGTVNVGKHGFKIVPADVVREGDTITVQGKFFHIIKGGDAIGCFSRLSPTKGELSPPPSRASNIEASSGAGKSPR